MIFAKITDTTPNFISPFFFSFIIFRFDFIGIYVIMFEAVFVSLLKVGCKYSNHMACGSRIIGSNLLEICLIFINNRKKNDQLIKLKKCPYGG